MDDKMITPRAPRRRARASLSMATPPSNLTRNRTPFSTVGDSGGPREGRDGRASFPMATRPLAVSGGGAAGATGSGQRLDGSPWLGGRAESPSTGSSPLPSTRGEMNHFRRAEELWKKASKAREGSRRRTMGAAPSLEQRMAWRREEEAKERLERDDDGGKRRRRQRLRNGLPEQENGQERSSTLSRPTPHQTQNGEHEPAQQQQQQQGEGEGEGVGEIETGGVRTGDGGGVGVGVRPPLTPGTQRAARVLEGSAAVAAVAGGGGGSQGALGEEGDGKSGDSRGGLGAQGVVGGVREEKGSGGKDGLNRATVRAKVLAIYEEHNREKLHMVDETLDKYEGRWVVMLERLEQKYISASGLPPASGSGPLCFMDIEVGGQPVGRLVFHLFADKTPKAAENFRALCTGEKGRGLRYEGSAFHRIVPGFVVQGGDFTTGDGRGGKSIYGDKFEDEPFMRHHKLGLLSMANKGANTNNSQFFITLKAVAHLDGKHVVFGEVQSGIKVLDRMKSVTLLEPKREGKPAPEQRVVIASCGQLDEDGTEVRRAAAPNSTASTSTPLFGRPSNLGDPPTKTGSTLGGAAAAATATDTGASSAFPLGQLSGASASAGSGGSAFAQGFGGSSSSGFGGGGGGLFGSEAKTPAVPSLFGQPTAAAAAAAAAAAPLATPDRSETKGNGGGGEHSICSGLYEGEAATSKLSCTPGLKTVASSFGSLAAAIAAGPPGRAKAAPAASQVADGGNKGGVSTPASGASYFATPPSDLAAVAVRVAALTPPSGARRSSGPRPPGGAAGAAFDRLDEAGSGWVGQEEFEVLVGCAGLPFEADEHGRDLLELCSPRLPRDRFLAWYAAARKAQREGGDGSAVKQVRAGMPVGSGGSSSSGSAGEAEAVAVDGAPDSQNESPTAVVPQTASPGTSKPATPNRETPKNEDSNDACGGCGGEGAGEDSCDESRDEDERRDERAKAEAAFDKVDSAAKGWVDENQFEALMEAVGTTYSVEDHRPKLLSICSGGRLEKGGFLSWYDDWLFDEDDSSDEEGKDEEVNASAAGPAAKGGGFASLLKRQAGGWKCSACLVSHPESSVKCLSCEAVKPGEESKVKAVTTPGSGILGLSSGGSTGGFTFGVPVAVTKATETVVAPSSIATNAEGGFTFGAPLAPTAATTAPASAAILPLVPSADMNASRGFTFGAPVPESSASAANAEPAVVIASIDGVEEHAAAAGSSGDGDSGDEEEHREERAKAETAFDKVDSAAKGWVDESQFEALMEAVGTTYSVEDHRPKLLSICRDSRVERGAFISWYDDWLFGEDDSSNEEDQVDSASLREAAKGGGFASLLKSQAGGWKCDACYVSNPESSVKCLSCETVKPGEEGKVADSVATGGTVERPSSSESTGGFTFGAPVVVATSPMTAAVSSSVATNAEGGFTFGGPLSAGAPTPAAVVPSVPGAETNVSGGFTFGALVPESSAPAASTEPAAVTASIDEVEEDAAAAGSSDDSGSEDERERREERAKAETAFDKVDSAAKGRVDESQFEALMEAVGTTYSVEDHRPKLLSICRDSQVERGAFISWYDDWLFGEDDSSNEDQVDSASLREATKGGGFASLLKSQAGGWKCDACYVSNPESSVKCLSCETVKPGEEGKVADSVATGGTVERPSSSESTGGFTFGAPVVVATSPMTAAVSSSVATNAEGGFSFGGPLSAGAPTSAAVVPSVPGAETNVSGGFTFGALVPESSAPAASTEPAVVTASIDEEEEDAAAAGSSDDSGSGDERERREERAKAETAFDKVDSAAKGWVDESQFEALMEAVGTTYSVEDHRPKLISICSGGRLERGAFISWYDDWLFGEDDSSNEEDQVDSASLREAAKGGGFASLLKSQAGGWKCDACYVSNPESSVKCLSCETVKPGEEGKVADSVATGGTVERPSGSESTGGFTFGAPVVVATSPTTAAVSSSVATNAEGGFTFGAPLSVGAPTPAAVVPSVPGAETNVSGGFTFGALVPESSAPAASTEPAAVTASIDGVEERAAAAGSSDDSGSEDERERREERAKAETAFDKVDSAAKGWVDESQFEALMEAVGTTYSVEDHRPKLLSICRDSRVERGAFISWYDDWLFGEDGSSNEEDQVDSASLREAAKGGGFASLLKSQAGGWKCDACYVSNPESSVKCLSCETVKPGEEGKVADSVATGGTVERPSSSESTGGFTFGAPVVVATSPTTAAVSSSVATNAEGGFTFGAPLSAEAPTSAAVVPSVPGAGTNASGGFTFGALVPESSAPATSTEPAAVTASIDGVEEDAAAAGSSYDSGSGDERERREERAKAETAFDKVDSAAKGWVDESQFEALMEAVGTTYSVEDHRPKLISICSGGRLERGAFISWYDDWLFGEDDSSNEEDQVDSASLQEAAKGGGFASLLKSQAGGWKCDACYVSNPESSVKCLSCETVKPGEEGKVAGGVFTGGTVAGCSSDVSTGGFTFGAPVAAAAAAETATVSSSVATNAEGGFTFGGPLAPTAATSAAVVPSVPSAETKASGGFTVGAPVPESLASAPDTEPAVEIASVDEAKADGAAGGTHFTFGSPNRRFTFASPARQDKPVVGGAAGRDGDNGDGGGAAASGGEAREGGGSGAFGNFMSPPRPVRKLGGGGGGGRGNLFGTGSLEAEEEDQGGPAADSGPSTEGFLSPRVLANLTPRTRARRRASASVTRGRRASVGPPAAAGQSKILPVGGVGGGAAPGAGSTGAVSVRVGGTDALQAAAAQEEKEGPSLSGGEPKIY